MAFFQRTPGLLLLLIIFPILIIPSVLNATTYYVSISGNDANPGTQAQPWRTIQNAADMMDAGDTALVSAGTYNERVTTRRSGAARQLIEFRAIGQVSVGSFTVKSNDYIKINGFRFSSELGNYNAFIKIEGSHCIASNNVISYSGISSISGLTVAGSYNVVSNNTIDGLKYPNINVGGNNNLFEGNTIKNTCHDAMRIWGHDHTIRGNVFRDMYNSGITHVDLFQTFGDNGGISYNILIENNHFKNCRGTQIGNFTQDGVQDIRDWTFRNNIFENIQLQANIYVPGFRFYNNTFFHCDQNTGGPLLFKDGGATRGVPHNSAVVNNFFIDCGSRPEKTGWYSVAAAVKGFCADYNYVAGPESAGFPAKAGFNEPHGINGGDPRFVSIANSDFKLQPDSPALERGKTIGGFDYDKDGGDRPQGSGWDIGAYEGAGLTAPKRLRVIANTAN